MAMEQIDRPQLKKALGFWQLLFYGVAFMVPIAPIVIYGVVTQVTGGHMAMAYLLAMIAMLFTAASYGQMAGEFPEAGSTYSYTRHGLNAHLGMLAGWTILLDYVLMPALSYVVIAVFGAQLIPSVPYWVWIVIPLLLVTVVNIIGVKQMAGTTVVLLLLQLGVLAYFFIMALAGLGHGTGQGFTIRPFYSENLQLGAVIAGTSIACFSFLGFDAISTLAEETRRPRTDISRATLMACLFAGFLFIAQAFFAQNLWPNYSSFPDLEAAFYFVAEQVGGQPLSIALTLGMIIAALANAVDAQAASARLLFGMGRDGVLPKRVFGVSPSQNPNASMEPPHYGGGRRCRRDTDHRHHRQPDQFWCFIRIPDGQSFSHPISLHDSEKTERIRSGKTSDDALDGGNHLFHPLDQFTFPLQDRGFRLVGPGSPL